MKLTLSLLAAVALAACASDKEAQSGANDVQSTINSSAPKAARVSLAVEGMT